MDDIEFDFEMAASPEETHTKQVLLKRADEEQKKDKTKRTVCRHWLKHECQRGDACTYLHAMDLDKMPDCDLGANCNRPDCIFKHPPKLNDVKDVPCCDFLEGVSILQAGVLPIWKEM